MFERDNKKSNANTCMLKVATFSAEKSEHLLKAAKIFEDIANENLSSRLGAFSAKGYFLQALLCHLALGDQVQVRNKLEEYKNLDYSFGSSREEDFITKLIEVIDRGTAFTFYFQFLIFLILFISKGNGSLRCG
jgi:alpha-soluble NSF attachment protein